MSDSFDVIEEVTPGTVKCSIYGCDFVNNKKLNRHKKTCENINLHISVTVDGDGEGVSVEPLKEVVEGPGGMAVLVEGQKVDGVLVGFEVGTKVSVNVKLENEEVQVQGGEVS